MIEKLRTKCPICRKSVVFGDSEFPFCSDRCRTVDLGNWASEKYVITEPLQAGAMDLDEDAE